MKALRKYLYTIFGSAADVEEYTLSSHLPVYLTEKYLLFKLRIQTHSYLLAMPKDKLPLQISSLKKQLYQLEKHTALKTVLLTEQLRLSQRNMLIQAGIAFIVPEKQLYIPQNIILLTEEDSVDREYGEHFAVATQVVFNHLLLQHIEKTNAHQLAETLAYSVPAINRALKELNDRKLLVTEGNRTRKQYIITNRKMFWDLGKKFLFDPVKTRKYVKLYFDHHDFLMSNDLALSRLSMLNDNGISYYALSATDLKKIDDDQFLDPYDSFDQRYSVIEVFRYDPKLLSTGRYIDVFSLYAQFKNHPDMRVQMEIERLVDEVL